MYTRRLKLCNKNSRPESGKKVREKNKKEVNFHAHPRAHEAQAFVSVLE